MTISKAQISFWSVHAVAAACALMVGPVCAVWHSACMGDS